VLAGGTGCFVAGLTGLILAAVIIPLVLAFSSPGMPLFDTIARLNPTGPVQLAGSFGDEGNGPGLFSDPRGLAVDTDGSLYVADFETGRIQHFDPDGRFLNDWTAGPDQYITTLAARDGVVYAPAHGRVLTFDGDTGQSLGEAALPDSEFGGVDAVAMHPDGGLVVVRGGEDLMRYGPDGGLVWQVKAAVSSVTGDSELNVRPAVDPTGNVYLIATFNDAVFKYSPEGRYLTHWGSDGDGDGQFRAMMAIAADGQGRVFVSDIHGIQIFSANGEYMDSFKPNGVAFGLNLNPAGELIVVSNQHEVYRYTMR
jgi:DNA-binding beta-propeller fold protein YncE